MRGESVPLILVPSHVRMAPLSSRVQQGLVHVSVESMVCGSLFSALGGVARSAAAAAAPRTALDPDLTGAMETEAQHSETSSCASKEGTSLDHLCLMRVLLFSPDF